MLQSLLQVVKVRVFGVLRHFLKGGFGALGLNILIHCGLILLMEEIPNNHPTCMKPCK